MLGIRQNDSVPTSILTWNDFPHSHAKRVWVEQKSKRRRCITEWEKRKRCRSLKVACQRSTRVCEKTNKSETRQKKEKKKKDRGR